MALTAFWHPLSLLRGALDRLAGVVYPKSCLSCRVLVQCEGALCAECLRRVRFIEHPLCPVLGIPFAHGVDVGMVSPAAIADPPAFVAARSVTLYDEVARGMVHRLKYNDRADLALPMARWMLRASDGLLERADIVIPVPLHRGRLFSRRYNQSAELARAVARIAGKAYSPTILLRHRATVQQVGLGQKARETNVRGAFMVPAKAQERLSGKRVLLVDDVYTTGATVNAASRALRRGGAAEVYVLTFARVHGVRLAGHET
jgi:ComF family protein